jgi:hypothetical protein
MVAVGVGGDEVSIGMGSSKRVSFPIHWTKIEWQDFESQNFTVGNSSLAKFYMPADMPVRLNETVDFIEKGPLRFSEGRKEPVTDFIVTAVKRPDAYVVLSIAWTVGSTRRRESPRQGGVGIWFRRLSGGNRRRQSCAGQAQQSNRNTDWRASGRRRKTRE